jgi:hypothetical protein
MSANKNVSLQKARYLFFLKKTRPNEEGRVAYEKVQQTHIEKAC